ncbi:MAG: phosphotransferase [Microbacteriaceae bacterium]
MALSPIMLTAWAVAEIPDLHIDGYRETSTETLERVTCRTAEGAIVSIASPLTADAAAIQDREHRVGQILSAGVRERLGFDVPHTLGAGVLNKRRIVVTEEVQGQPLSAARDKRPMLPSLALALASLHSLPTSIVKRDSVPSTSALDSVREAAGIIDRSHQTTRVPSALLDRWDAAIEDTELWQFVPTFIHGDLDFDHILTAGDDVVGMIRWSEASVGDPARDLLNIVGPLAPEITTGFVVDYIAHRGNNDHRVGHRARFLSELEIARYLVHGVDTENEGIVNEAVAMLNTLVTTVTDNPAMALGAMPIKPVSLLTDDSFEMPTIPDAVTEVAAPAFVEDAPTVVAEEIADDAEALVESDAFVEDAPTLVAEPAPDTVDGDKREDEIL